MPCSISVRKNEKSLGREEQAAETTYVRSAINSDSESPQRPAGL